MITINVQKELDFEDIKDMVWSGAINTINTIEEHGKSEEFMQMLSEIFYENIPTDTEINDLLWFEPEYIYENLGITDDDEENGE